MARGGETGSVEAALQRVLMIFDQETDELVAELPLVDFDLAKFKMRFQGGADDEDELMVCCYQVKPEDVEFITEFLAKTPGFDFDKYSYFVEAYMSNGGWIKYYANSN